MSKLIALVRPVQVFDPDNQDHRFYMNEYIRTKSWKNCPVRFVTNDTTNEVVNTIQRQLLEYYCENEFAENQTQ